MLGVCLNAPNDKNGGKLMAKDILDAVRNAEKECDGIVSQAQKKADEIIESANRRASELIEAQKQKAKDEADGLLASVKEENEKTVRDAEKTAAEECKRLCETAQKNRQSVIDSAIEKFF